MATVTTVTSGLASAGATWDTGTVPVEDVDKVIVAAPGTQGGTDRLTDAAGYAIGATSITVAAGLGTILVGESVQFGTDETYYRITTGATSAISTIVITPALVVAIPAVATNFNDRGHVLTLDGAYSWGDDSVTTTIDTAAVNIKGALFASRTVNSSLTGRGLILVNAAATINFGTDASPIPDGIVSQLILNKRAVAADGSGIQQLWAAGAAGYISQSYVGWNGRTRGAALSADVAAAATVINLTSSAHGWKVGDRILLMATTNAAAANEVENRIIASISAAAITFTAAVTYAHKAGSPACNLTSNVIIRSFSPINGQMAKPIVNSPNSNFGPSDIATKGYYYKFRNVEFQAMGGSDQFQGGVIIGGNAPTRNQGYTIDSCTFMNLVNSAAAFQGVVSVPTPFLNCVVYTLVFFHVGGNLEATNSYFALGSFSDGGVAITHTNNWVSLIGNQDQPGFTANVTHRNLTLSGRGLRLLASSGLSVLFDNCDLGFTYGYQSVFSTGYIYNFNDPWFAFGISRFKDCVFHTRFLTPDLVTNTVTARDGLNVIYENKGRVLTTQEIYTNRHETKRSNTEIKRSPSSTGIKPIIVAKDSTRIQFIPCAANATIRIVGYIKADTAFYNGGGAGWNAPTVTISGLGIVPVVFTATATANNAFEGYDISATNNVTPSGGSSPVDGNFTLTSNVNARLVTTGTVFFDGVPDAPFITKARHYGFLFDESSPVRTKNITVTQPTAETVAAYATAETTAIAITDITVTWGALLSTVALGASRTFQNLYDSTQAQAAATVNLASALPLTGAGVAGSPSLFAAGNLTTTGFTLNGAGSISMGSLTLTASIPWVYTYTGGTFSQAAAVPSFSGGTLEVGAAGTFTYIQAASTLLRVTPTAPSTYNLGAGTFTGTLTVNNMAAHAITVEVPAGTTTSTTGNTGGAITFSAPLLYQSVTITGITTTSRVQIYDNSVIAPVGSRVLYNAVPGATSIVWTDPAAAITARIIRVRIADVVTVVAKKFIEGGIGTCGITASNKDISYLATQLNDTTYNTNAIDGPAGYAASGVTFTDAATDLVVCNIAGGSVSWKSIYAWFVHWNHTSVGISNDFTYVDAPDTANYLLSGMKVRNTNVNPLTITGGYGRDATTGLVADAMDRAGSTGNLYPSPDHVVPFSTGSGLTAGQDAQLMGLPSSTTTATAVLAAATATPIAANIKRVNGTAVAGAGTTSAPWGP